MGVITDHWLSDAKRIYSPYFDARPGDSTISLLVLHGISLPKGVFGNGFVADLFTNKLDYSLHPTFDLLRGSKLSPHLFIDRQGNISQFVSFKDRAWHAGESNFQGKTNCNDFSIGIELEGTDEIPYTNEQYSRLALVIPPIMDCYPDITMRRIVGHSEIAPERKTDPGTVFDWQRLYRLLRECTEFMSW